MWTDPCPLVCTCKVNNCALTWQITSSFNTQILGTVLPTEKMFLGVLLRKTSKGLHKIVQVFDGSPADDAEVIPGSMLLKVISRPDILVESSIALLPYINISKRKLNPLPIQVDHVDVSNLSCDEVIEFTRRFEHTKFHLEVSAAYARAGWHADIDKSIGLM